VRGLSGYLRDRPIWAKLGLIMMLPTIATIAVSFAALISNTSKASDANRTRAAASLTAQSGALVQGLQDERSAATALLATPNPRANALKNLQTTYKNSFQSTEQAIGDYRVRRNALRDMPDTFVAKLQVVDSGITSLAALRSAVLNNNITLNGELQGYGSVIDSLLAIRSSSAQLAGDAALSYEIQSGAALARLKEWLSQERVVGLQALLSGGKLDIGTQESFLGTLTAQGQALSDFINAATPDQYELLTQTYTGPEVRQTNVFETDMHLWMPGMYKPGNLASPADWDNAFSQSGKLLRQVEQRIDAETVSDATRLRSTVQGQALVEFILLLTLVLVAILIAWLVARSMIRTLRELRLGALAIAQYGLPQAVARLRDPALSTQHSPHQVALQIADPLPIRSRDEFGQVTEAFNAVHLEAVRTAAEQAALRASVATMFVNLARRSQILVDRLIGHLDRLERGEEDPDHLAELFQLDHLATRMRRNDENLLVLAGADSTRVQREPAALIDVLRAAQSEVEHYTRIEFGVIDRDLEVASHAVNDLVHLIAELFDNATAFSPPDSGIVVEARRVSDRAVLYVEDHGIGISPDQMAELNERLATPPEVDVTVSRMMGLVVVARLAARHGVKVELRPAHDRGTVADVMLPTSVLVPRALAGHNPEMPIVTSGGTQASVPAQRGPFGSPLALESGPVGSNTGSFGAVTANGAGASRGLGGFAGTGTGAFATGPAGGSGPPGGTGSLPAWSDLTGAVNGASQPGVDLFPGAGRNGDDEDTLPRRRSGGAQADGPVPEPAVPEPAVPSGCAPDPDLAPPDQHTPRIPRQTPASPEAFRGFDRDRVLDHSTPAPLASDSNMAEDAPGSSASTAGAPPAAWPWPPVADEPVHADDTPPVPEEFSAALDITSEIPRMHGERTESTADHRDVDATVEWNWPTGTHRSASAIAAQPVVPQPYAPPVAPASPAAPEPVGSVPEPSSTGPQRIVAYADETMELPIFRELESAWFRTRPEDAEAADDGGTSHDADASPGPGESAELPRRYAAVPANPVVPAPAPERPAVPMAQTRIPAPEPSWRTAADEGWHAAQVAADPTVSATTSAGLPKRVPMAQLVPGGVEKQPVNSNRRSPEQVRGLLSAYHRGVQRGRSHSGDDARPESSTPTGNSHGGKEL
jgi:signal transduction histidine kinase